jgi:hypothetical protein
MYGTILGFALLRLARAACESLDIQQGVVFLVKGVCALYLILFFLYMKHWGLKLLDRLESMNNRTSIAGGKDTKSSIKKNAALRRFQNFLAWESIVSSVWLAELTASSILKSYAILTLETKNGALAVFALKVVQRGTEWIMMFLLSYLVCLKTVSNNFTMNYRLPTITVPVICSGSGWCANVRNDVDEEVFQELIERDEEAPRNTRTFIRRALGLTMTSFGRSSSFFSYNASEASRISQVTARTSQGTARSSQAGSIQSVRERRNSKREAINEANRRLVQMPKGQKDKRKREFGKVKGKRNSAKGTDMLRRPSATGGIELPNRAGGGNRESGNAGSLYDIYNNGNGNSNSNGKSNNDGNNNNDDNNERGSEFVGENPMAQQRTGTGGRGGRTGKKAPTTQGLELR